MASLTQDERLLRMSKGPLADDAIQLTGFSGHESISRLFNFHIEFLSTEKDIRPGDIIGKEIALEIDREDEEGSRITPRYFHGYINKIFAGDATTETTGVFKYRNYRAEIVPWVWFLTRTTRCFIYFPEKEDKTIFEIVEAVLNRAKNDLHVNAEFDLQGISDLKQRKVKHCVQYRESDFNFLSRMLEQYGAFYYFKFEDGKHTLVVDMKKKYPKCEEAEVQFPADSGTQIHKDHITSWQHYYEFVSGKFEHKDYNFETPLTDIKANAPKLPEIDLKDNDKYEIYDYPGEYANKDEGKADAERRQEEEEARHNIVQGTSLCKSFTPGFTFKLIEHPDEQVVTEQDNSYLITSVQHSASQPGPDGDEGYASNYTNSFTCIPDSIQYRPQRSTPKPLVSGVQTAVVTGGSGEEIFPDKYGRVKVQFHWDREGQKDENTSCWIRVSQIWAGKTWGSMHIPHVGQEVIVDFEEGDPDRPIIIGRVYNADQTVPLPLPDEKTKSIIRDHGNNQLIMEGKEGQQFIHLQQECGNELLLNGMEGEESVQLRDKYGNELFMNAVDGTIRLSSPSHDSTIVLGQSIFQRVDSNNSSFTEGNTINVHKGLKHDVYIGQRSQSDVGNYMEFMGGMKGTLVLGMEVNARVGYTVNVQYAKEVTHNALDYVQHSVGRVKIDSESEVGIVGGAGDASRAQFGPSGLCLSYKETGASPRKAMSIAGWSAVAATAIAAAHQAGNGVIMGQNKANLDTETTDKSKAWSDATIGEYAAITTAAVGAVGSAGGMFTATNTSDTEDWSTGEADAKVELTDKGLELYGVKGKNHLKLKKDGEIELGGEGDVFINNMGKELRIQRLVKYGDKRVLFTADLKHANFEVK